MLVFAHRYLGKGSMELREGQIQGVIVDVLLCFFQGIKEDLDLPQVAMSLLSVPTAYLKTGRDSKGHLKAQGSAGTRYPLPSSTTCAPR